MLSLGLNIHGFEVRNVKCAVGNNLMKDERKCRNISGKCRTIYARIKPLWSTLVSLKLWFLENQQSQN